MPFVQVAVPVPQLDALTYSVPDEFPDPPAGARVLVPVGKRVLTGVVVSTTERRLADGGSRLAGDCANSEQSAGAANRQTPIASRHEIKPIIDILDSTPFLPSDVLKLAQWVAEYYACGIGEAVATAMPPRSWIESERHAHLTDL